MLAKLGAKAAARPRIPASIGHGMARKQAQRDERALLEGIAGAAPPPAHAPGRPALRCCAAMLLRLLRCRVAPAACPPASPACMRGLKAGGPDLPLPLPAAGMIQQKGMGKKKRREKGKKVDRGLMEDGGAFRPGILRVKPLPGSGGGTAGGKRRK